MTKIRQNILTVSLDKVIPNTWNYNEQVTEMFDKTKANIKQFGFLKPLVVRENNGKYEIINGFHRWLACKELGYKEISVNNLGKVQDEEAKLLTILLNELKGQPNAVKLGRLIDGLYNSNSWENVVGLLPFGNDEIENFRKIANEQLAVLNEVAKETQKEIVYQLVVTTEHAVTIEKALKLFEEHIPMGERFYELAVKFKQMEESNGG